MKQKVLCLDISNMIMRALFAQMPSPTEKKFDLFKATFFTSFFKIIADNNPNLVLCCIDSGSWRKDIFSGYKASRQAKRDASIINFDLFFQVWGKLLEQLKKAFEETNIKFIEIPKVEADDIIAVTTKYNPEWEIINVSSDRDYLQLYKYKNYRQWEPIKKEFLSTLNPESDLLIKILCGDKSDEIPSLKRGTGPKTAQKIIDNGTLDAWLTENNLNEDFKRNQQLVSFDCIPMEYVEEIRRKINEITLITEPSAKEFSTFIFNSGLSMLSINQSDYVATIQSVR